MAIDRLVEIWDRERCMKPVALEAVLVLDQFAKVDFVGGKIAAEHSFSINVDVVTSSEVWGSWNTRDEGSLGQADEIWMALLQKSVEGGAGQTEACG